MVSFAVPRVYKTPCGVHNRRHVGFTIVTKSYIDEMDDISNSADFTIDSIEEKWTELVESTKQIYKEVNAQIIERINERQIIQEKKRVRQEGSDAEE